MNSACQGKFRHCKVQICFAKETEENLAKVVHHKCKKLENQITLDINSKSISNTALKLLGVCIWFFSLNKAVIAENYVLTGQIYFWGFLFIWWASTTQPQNVMREELQDKDRLLYFLLHFLELSVLLSLD